VNRVALVNIWCMSMSCAVSDSFSVCLILKLFFPEAFCLEATSL
jgi:hypothetical protein